jgi:MFS family permease
MGRIIDQSSCRLYIAAGALIWVITSALLLIPPFTGLLVACRFLQGFGYALFYTASLIYATRSVSDEWRGTVIGMVEAIGALAIALTPFLGIWILSQKGFKAAFITAGLVAFLTFLCTIFLTVRPPTTPEDAAKIPFRLISRQAMLPGLVASTLFFVAIAFVSLSPLIAQHLGVANISLYLALRAICTVPTRLLSGFVSDRKGFSWAIVPGFIIAGVGMLLLPFLILPGWAMLVPILFGLGMGIASPALTNWMLSRVDKAQHAVAVNTFTLLTESAGFLGTWLVGLFLQTGNLRWLLFLALILIVGLGFYLTIVAYQRASISNTVNRISMSE